MKLRPHQAEMQTVCTEILSGKPVKKIIAAVTPGGGKSALPVIAASLLIPAIADRLVWIVPRNSLKWQGEAEFVDPRWDTQNRLRACHGNDADPDRGNEGYLTTYQAIGVSSKSHQDYVRKHRTILFLDEPHHVADDAAWGNALAPMIESAVLVVYASGTFSRADGRAIHGLDYSDNGFVDFLNTETTRIIRYGRNQAIEDKATMKVELKIFDGSASWISKEGIQREVSSLKTSGEDRADAVYTALRTDFAYALLSASIEHWEQIRKDYPSSKLLVVAPDIETAKLYHSRLAPICLAEIATSEDSIRAHKIIDAFRSGSVPALVTVGMAYEGLSVPEITHIACLTQIRSVPWLEQMQARANRRSPGKPGAWVFAPADRALIRAWKMIEEEALIPLEQKEEADKEEVTEGPKEGGEGWQAPQIKPLWSSAHGIESDLPEVKAVAPSVAEGVLRDNIRAIRRRVVDQARPGSQKALASMFSHYVRQVADKDLDDMTATELESVWISLREKFKGRL